MDNNKRILKDIKELSDLIGKIGDDELFDKARSILARRRHLLFNVPAISVYGVRLDNKPIYLLKTIINNYMETKEIRITPPEGYEIDKENSTFDCIKFKPVAKKWRGKKDSKLNGFYIGIDSSTILATNYDNIDVNHNIFATKKQAKSAVAMAQISQIMANDERFGGVVTDEEWNSPSTIYTIERYGDRCKKASRLNWYSFLAFHTPLQCDLFLKENEDLVKDYLMID